jgi:hypothetical protein
MAFSLRVSASFRFPLYGMHGISAAQPIGHESFFQPSIDGRFVVSGFCQSDGEAFLIRHVTWNGEALSFEAEMPSTGHVAQNRFRMRPDGCADLELTLYEVWKKKDVQRGVPPAAWSSK